MKRSLTSIWNLGTALACVFAISACSSAGKSESEKLAENAPPAQTANTKAAPTDEEIAHIVETANTNDIETGKIAQKTSKNKEVKKYAKMMVTDHTALNKQLADLASKAKLTPSENEVSKGLKSTATETTSKLKSLKGKEFDQAYIDNEVSTHQALLSTIDTTLIPNAKNTELKNMLTKVRPSIEAHLSHAKQIQATITK